MNKKFIWKGPKEWSTYQILYGVLDHSTLAKMDREQRFQALILCSSHNSPNWCQGKTAWSGTLLHLFGKHRKRKKNERTNFTCDKLNNLGNGICIPTLKFYWQKYWSSPPLCIMMMTLTLRIVMTKASFP